jgi:hypothetical protein
MDREGWLKNEVENLIEEMWNIRTANLGSQPEAFYKIL